MTVRNRSTVNAVRGVRILIAVALIISIPTTGSAHAPQGRRILTTVRGPHAPLRQDPHGPNSSPPRARGYFALKPMGSWSTLPGGKRCSERIHRSTWEPRPQNAGPNGTIPNASAVAAAFEIRPRSVEGTYRRRWDTWLLPRVNGHFRGRTDEIFQWAACKWGLSDNMLRAIAVRESTWFQSATYPSGRCVLHYGCGDMFSTSTTDSEIYCDGLETVGGYDYQADFGSGNCPKTFSIVGVMSWADPAWVAPSPAWEGNQNGTFPFNRDSTAFAVDFLASYLRGCYEGWVKWLYPAGGKIWGCVGSWYSGDWLSTRARGYIGRVKNEIVNHTWLRRRFASITPGCHPTYGCPD